MWTRITYIHTYTYRIINERRSMILIIFDLPVDVCVCEAHQKLGSTSSRIDSRVLFTRQDLPYFIISGYQQVARLRGRPVALGGFLKLRRFD